MLFLLLSVPSLVWAFADWVTSGVDEQVSVQAPVSLATIDMSKVIEASPGAAKEELVKMTDTKMLAARDASGVYMVLRLNGEIPGADFRRQQDRTEFFTGYIGSTVERDHGYLLERASFMVNGMEGVDFTYKRLHQFAKKWWSSTAGPSWWARGVTHWSLLLPIYKTARARAGVRNASGSFTPL